MRRASWAASFLLLLAGAASLGRLFLLPLPVRDDGSPPPPRPPTAAELAARLSLRHLTRLKGLRHLDLGGCTITSDGLAYVAEISSLRSLDLCNERISPRGVASLQALPDLRRLRLYGSTCVDDEMLQEVAGIASLVDVEIWGEHITDAGVASLARLRRLRRVELALGRVTGTALAAFAGHPRLEELRIESLSNLAAPALSQLAAIPRLRALDLATPSRRANSHSSANSGACAS